MKHRRHFYLLPTLVIISLMAAAVFFLWNAVMPHFFPVTPLTYWQALGLLILCRILLGDLRWGNRPHFSDSTRPDREKWMRMNEEEKQKFKDEWRKRHEPPQS